MIVGQAIIYQLKKSNYNTTLTQQVVYYREGFMGLNTTTPEEQLLISNHRFLKVTNLDETDWELVVANFGKTPICYNNNGELGERRIFLCENAEAIKWYETFINNILT